MQNCIEIKKKNSSELFGTVTNSDEQWQTVTKSDEHVGEIRISCDHSIRHVNRCMECVLRIRMHFTFIDVLFLTKSTPWWCMRSGICQAKKWSGPAHTHGKQLRFRKGLVAIENNCTFSLLLLGHMIDGCRRCGNLLIGCHSAVHDDVTVSRQQI